MNAAFHRIESGIAAAVLRIAETAPALALLGPAAAIAALLTAWLAGRCRAPAAA